MGKKIKVFLGLLVLILLGALGFLGFQIDQGTTHLISQEKTIENEKKFLEGIHFSRTDFEKKYNYKEMWIKNQKEDYNFPVDTYRLKEGGDLFILIHPLGGTGKIMAPFCQVFLDRGYSVLAYDQWNAGRHPRKKNTLGVREKDDLISLVRVMKKRYPRKKIHIFAMSYGCNTVLQAYSSIQEDLDFFILDSPMARGENYIKEGLLEASQGSKPAYELFGVLGNLSSKLLEGYSYQETNGLDQVDTISQPLLIISNKEDQVTPFSDALGIYKKAMGKKTLVESHSPHAKMFFEEREAYLQALDRFLRETSKKNLS